MAANDSVTNKPLFPATVVHVVNRYRVAINRGSIHGLKRGQRFLVYTLSSENIRDPESGEDLGPLEIVRGIGFISHLQDKLATIESDRTERSGSTKIVKRNPLVGLGIGYSEEVIDPPPNQLPFDDPSVGDRARPI